MSDAAPAPTGETGVDEHAVSAPIVAVTVFADRARITRRGVETLPVGEQQVVIDGLPLSLQHDSVRVTGTGPASVLGVDIVLRRRAIRVDETVRRLEKQLREARAAIASLDDEDAVAAQRLEFLAELARRATRSYAAALSTGQIDPAKVAELSDAFDVQQAAVRERRRELARRRQEAWDKAAACERELADRRGSQAPPDQYAAVVALNVAEPGPVTLDLSYVVDGARWQSAYDARLVGDELTLTWFALVSQFTGEDWPECDLRLSTARPATAAAVPELKPWFLDRLRPPTPIKPAARSAGESAAYGGVQAQSFALKADTDLAMRDAVAELEQGATAATYTPVRVAAVPADGNSHRSTVAVITLMARRDYLTAPVLAPEAHLRATVVNTSPHTLPRGVAAVFHGGDFVGSAALDTLAPGEEVELALGIDDRVRVERELVRRTAVKAVLGSTRRRETEHRITVTNHTPDRIALTVLDQLPVSRDDAIAVKESRLDPAPTERTDLGVLTWAIDLAAGEKRQLYVGVRVEVAKGAELVGWRE